MVDFAAHLVSSLDNSIGALPDSCPDVLLYTSVLPLTSKDLCKAQRTILRQHAVAIWNHCNVLLAIDRVKVPVRLAQLRAFAFLLLATVIPHNKKSHTKLFNKALVALKECLQADLLELASKILEYEATTHMITNEGLNPLQDQDKRTRSLEFSCLRMLLDHKRGRLDLAESSFEAITNALAGLDHDGVEKVIDLCFEIGSDCVLRGDHVRAVDWLGRAVGVLDHDDYAACFAGSDLRMNVLHFYGNRPTKSALLHY